MRAVARGTRRRRVIAVGAVIASGWLLVTPTTGQATSTTGLELRVLSNRADLVSGGDALVEVVIPAGVPARSVRVTADRRDVTSSFAVRADKRFYGLVRGLAVGPNALVATLPDGTAARLVVTNHPSSGPIFAGRQVQPWICTNTANGLGKPVNAACDTKPVLSYFYKDAVTGNFSEYDPENPPADASIATTTTDTGRTVKYIVRQERGVLDRGIYQIGVLFDPAQPWQAWAPQPAWARKVVITTGVACDAGHEMQAPESVLVDLPLSHGWAVIGTELDNNTQNCNDVVQAEAFMMLKEHFVEQYGEMLFTLGSGCSGGSMAQHSMAANYPGLLDGIQPACSFPDMWTTYREMADCKLLAKYFTTTSPAVFTEPQRAAASGHASAVTCEFENTRADSYVSARGNSTSSACAGHPWTYDPQTNPRGERCDLFDYGVAVWGKRAKDGFANRAWDNVGLQYGLKALQEGVVLPEQFVDLNEKVGGLDIDGDFQSARTVADPAAIAIAYRTGRLTNGRELGKIPIMDLRGTSNFEEHFDFHTYEMRARLDRDNGTHANQVHWNSTCPLVVCPPMTEDSFDLMNRWLTAIKSDHSTLPQQVKVLRHKPADAIDACYVPGRKITDMTACRAVLPYFSDTRVVAGGPDTGDVVKCQLKPLAQKDYATFGVVFSDAQWARLKTVFPTGVCDFGKRGVAQQAPVGPWITFAAGPGGRPLGPPPRSQQIAGAAAVSTGGSAGTSLDATSGSALPTTGPDARISWLAVALVLTGVAGSWWRRFDRTEGRVPDR